MKFLHLRKTNHYAVAGFLIPFLCAGFASFYVLFRAGDYASHLFFVSFLGVVPFLLGAGLFLSIKSIALIAEKGDKDYAYSGLVLNLFLALLYLASLVYCYFKFSRP